MTVPQIAPLPEGYRRPTVSVVTATLNVLPALKSTVENVAAETGVEFEHVVVDGGSDDGTREFLEATGGGVRWISEPDGGIADAMNKGVALARGEWIIVLHAGDGFAAAGRLSEAAACFRPEIDVLLCGIRLGGRRDHVDHRVRFPRQRLLFKTIPHQGAFCRRSLFERIGGFDTTYRVDMDYEFFLRARRHGARFRSEPLILSSMDDGGVSSETGWPALARRFAEERRAQLAQEPGHVMRAVYAAYWPPYLAYRRLRARLAE